MKKLAWAQAGRARVSNVSVELCSDLLVPQQLSRSVQIFGAEGIVGEAVTGRRHVLDVLGILQPAIITGKLLGLHQHLAFGRFCHGNGGRFNVGSKARFPLSLD
jgi:hypothetical protein